MKNKKILYFICGISFLFFHCFGYVYQVSVMKKDQENPQIIIGIGDYHDKSHSANSSQRLYLESFIKKCKNAKLVVEDLSSINDDGRSMCGNFMINARGGVLGKLADVARDEGVDVDNVEYRYCRVAALGPLLKNVSLSRNNAIESSSILLKSLLKEVADEIERIQRYKDGVILNKLYNSCVREVTKAAQRFQLELYSNKSIADYCTYYLKNRYMQELEKMCIFDSSLIDMKIIHSIVSSPDKKIIIVAAGGSHIDKVTTFLTMIGYKKIMCSTTDSVNNKIIENALNSTDKNRNNIVNNPPALDLTILNQFIN